MPDMSRPTHIKNGRTDVHDLVAGIRDLALLKVSGHVPRMQDHR
jgi:hypothetical protein